MNLKGLAIGILALALGAGNVHAQDTVHVEWAVDTTLPGGVGGTTICNPKTNQPIVLVPTSHPTPTVLMHESVHVMQIQRAGGCPDGYTRITNTPAALLDLEAEAYCAEAYWTGNKYGFEPRKTLARALRWMVDFSVERAKIRGPEWVLTPGQVAASFNKFCPNVEPKYAGSSYTGVVDAHGQAHSTDSATPLDNHLTRP